MATLVIMPRQGQSVESCVITSWEKKKGDKVSVDDVLFTYETDKSSFEEKATVEGTLLEVFVSDGDDVPCLDPVCIIGQDGEDISSLLAEAKGGNAEAAPAETAAEEKKVEVVAAVATGEVKAGERMKISPRAKNLAIKTDADLSKVVPTGPNGRVIERDINALLDKGYIGAAKVEVEAAPAVAEAPAASAVPAAEFEDVKIPNIRKVIAKSMHASLSTMAQLTLNASFDATKIMAYRNTLKANAEKLGLPNITFNDMVLFAVAKTILNHKDINANYLDDAQVIRYFKHCNLGMAVDTNRGLMVPTIFNADELSLANLASQAKTLAKSAQDGNISPDLLKGASFTVSNLGSFGIESFTPVINPPQVAILGVDTISYKVKADGSAYPAMGLSLTIDHRAIDGAPGAKFLKELCANLENFDLLLAK